MRFKEFVLEKPMNDKTFMDVKKRLGATAKVGFEFEMVIPSSSLVFSDESDQHRSTQVISYYDTIAEFEEYFDISRSDMRSIIADKDEWVDDQRGTWVDDNWEEYADDDTSESEARQPEQFADVVPKELHRLLNFDKRYAYDYSDFANASTQEDKRFAAITLLNVSLAAVNNFKTSLSIKEKITLKKIASDTSLRSADVDQFFGSNHIARQKFNKEFAL